MKNLAMKVARSTVFAIAALALMTTFVIAQENFSGNLSLRNTVIKTNSEILALPKAPNSVDAFSPTFVFCFPGTPCTLEFTMTSELSDVSPGVDSLRYYASVDGAIVDVLPTSNLGINSTAKAGQMESGTGTWMRRNLAPGWHLVRVGAAVNDTNGDGWVSGFIGDRSLVIRAYSSQ
ncbi:MAG TPA: hypothetical protein VE422_13365 [Terriglobia bacterium]|nr:hypothetical protein [Terriglobia bacterium]